MIHPAEAEAFDITAAEHPSPTGFWAWIAEREMIRRRRAGGQPEPWTADPILQTFHFCNIRRADDAGTQWYLKNVAARVSDHKDLLWRTMFYRVVNSVAWFEEVFPTGRVPGRTHWMLNNREIAERIWRGPTPNSPAYLILGDSKPMNRKKKLVAALQHNSSILGYVALAVEAAANVRAVWQELQRFAGVGPFIAMQIYRDLALAGRLRQDETDFVYLGPGAVAGLTELYGPAPYAKHYQALVELWKDQPHGFDLPPGDIEQCLCEYAKYIKLRRGGGRRRYRRGHVAPAGPGSGPPLRGGAEDLETAGGGAPPP